MKTDWIEHAMRAGMATLSVKAITGRMFCATMGWKFGHRREHKVSGKLCGSLEDAIESLNQKLQEDAAEEMVRRGAA
jgi:hypothetical protein